MTIKNLSGFQKGLKSSKNHRMVFKNFTQIKHTFFKYVYSSDNLKVQIPL